MPIVLVIDDDPIVAVSVRDAVPDWTVLEAPDGATGLESVRTHRSSLDLVVVDMMMPHDGIMTCLQIRTEVPHIPILPFTGEAAYAATASELGCAPAVFKPASPSVLAAALFQAIGLAPPALPMNPLLSYLQQQATKSEYAVRLEQQAVLRVVVLASSEMLCAALQQCIAAAGGSVRIATSSASILRNGLGSLRCSLLVADSDIQSQAIDLAHTFGLPLLIVSRTMAAAYRAAELTQGIVVEPVSPRIMAEALHTVATGNYYRDTLLETILVQTGLTKTEQEVGRLVLQGLKDEEIAAILVQQRQTVRTHLTHLYSKLDVHSRDAFIAWAEAERVAQRGR